MSHSFYSWGKKTRGPSTHWIADWMAPMAGLDTMDKREISSSCWELNTHNRTITFLGARAQLKRAPHPQDYTSHCQTFPKVGLNTLEALIHSLATV
jgi:hypothetical protein